MEIMVSWSQDEQAFSGSDPDVWEECEQSEAVVAKRDNTSQGMDSDPST